MSTKVVCPWLTSCLTRGLLALRSRSAFTCEAHMIIKQKLNATPRPRKSSSRGRTLTSSSFLSLLSLLSRGSVFTALPPREVEPEPEPEPEPERESACEREPEPEPEPEPEADEGFSSLALGIAAGGPIDPGPGAGFAVEGAEGEDAAEPEAEGGPETELEAEPEPEPAEGGMMDCRNMSPTERASGPSGPGSGLGFGPWSCIRVPLPAPSSASASIALSPPTCSFSLSFCGCLPSCVGSCEPERGLALEPPDERPCEERASLPLSLFSLFSLFLSDSLSPLSSAARRYCLWP